METPLTPPKRKNPILRTRLPILPPSARSRVGLGLTAMAAIGRFALQTCEDCGAIQYPPREVCASCLSDDLRWRVQEPGGELLTETVLHHSMENFFRERAPWRMGIVRLDCGPNVIAFLHADCARAPSRVRVEARLDRSGHAVMVAVPEQGTVDMNEDPKLRELSCDPRFRKVLVTDAKSEVGQATVRAMVEAGAEIVWAGFAAPWIRPPGFDALAELPNVQKIPLDVTNADSVRDAAALVGAKVDILVNTAEFHRTHGVSDRHGAETARAEMEVNYIGLLRLAQDFGPALKARGADGQANAVAWVNLLSIYALANNPSQGTFSASKAAALSLSQNLRADLMQAGIRMINLFPGPIDEAWNQMLRPPKVAPKRIAQEIVAALRSGVEDVYPGEIAQDWLERWLASPKTLERELAR